jgi:hypothetical protein
MGNNAIDAPEKSLTTIIKCSKVLITIPARPLYDAQIGGLLFFEGDYAPC